MKIVFVKADLVVAVGSYHSSDIVVNCAVPDAKRIELPDDSPVDVGYAYDAATGEFTAPPPALPAPGPYERLIDIGPFFDRFGLAKMAVLTSDNATVRAIVQDVTVRKWVDLQRPDVAMALTVIGSIVPEVTATLRNSILNTPVDPVENLALRKLYFS